MAVEKIWSAYKPLADASTFVGDAGELFFDPATGEIRISDGSTPGGNPIALTITDKVDDADLLDGLDSTHYLNYNNLTNKPTIPAEYTDSDVVDLLANNFGANTIVTTGDISANDVNLSGNVEFNSPGSVNSVDLITFDTTANVSPSTPGHLCWNSDDETLNLGHPNGVVQQIGQELYMYARNNTGSTIPDGTLVSFAGAEQNGTARVEVAAFDASGSTPTLYAIGVTTEDITDGGDGRVTVWGKVRGIDMSAFSVGDILYANPSTVGGFTKTKPTAPNAVVSMAAVLNNDSIEGEMFVRPTILPQESYGKFTVTSDQTVTSTNTEELVDFSGSTTVSNGVDVVAGNTTRLQVNQSGLYQIDFSGQIDISGSGTFNSGTMYVWLKVNGTDLDNSMRRHGVINAVPSNTMSFTQVISLDADDYIEVAYAGDDTQLLFDTTAATAFGPGTASVLLAISQIQL